MKRNLFKTLFLALAMMCSLPALAQNKTVTGTVIDETGEPVIGATVRVEGTQTAVVTDLDGNYSIDVPKDGKIVVSYIGYKDMPTTGGRIQLQSDSNDLEEVVVVGYGVQKKAHLTGSVASVPMEDIQDLSSAGLASTLDGLVNGLNVSDGNGGRFGDRPTINIRDTNDFSQMSGTSGSYEPLFVIDGYIYPTDVKVGNVTKNLGAEAFNNLDPSEVESISVLKDASAAVYGSRAANGVILVTTKKGKMGAPRISYSGTFGFTEAVSHPKMLSAYDYGRLWNITKAADPKNTSLNYKSDLYQYDELEAMKSLNYDLLDKYWETGFTMQHSLNVSGATDRVNYFAGVSYFDQDGNLGKLDYDRWNYRAGIDVNISKWFKANLSVSGDYSDKSTPKVGIGSGGQENDYRNLLYRPRYIPETVGDYPIYAYGISNQKTSDSQLYSYDLLQNNGDYSDTMDSNVNINSSLDYDFGWSKIFKGLKLRFTYSKSISTSKNNDYNSQFTLYRMENRTGSGAHLYTPIAGEDYLPYLDPDNFRSDHPENNGGEPSISRNTIRTDNYQINFTATYARDFGKHHVNALFSIEKAETESEYIKGQLADPYPYTNYQSTGADIKTNEYRPIWTRQESGSLSYIGRINYAYQDRYLAEFLIRADASTKFAPENRWGYFPSGSLGWVMSEESWFRDKVHWIDFLKLRASFGLTGRDNTIPWVWYQHYDTWMKEGAVIGEGGTANSGTVRMNNDNAAVNRAVTWDKSYKFNFGIDARFFKQKLSVTFEAYKVWNRDMFMNMSSVVPGTVGTVSAPMNLGEMDNWGYELSLGWRDKIGKDFKYNINLNTGYSDNKVLFDDFDPNYTYMKVRQGMRSDVGVWGLQCIGMFRSFQDIEEYVKKYNITSYLGKPVSELRPGMLIYKDVRGKNGEATPDGEVDENWDCVQLSHRSNPYGFTINGGAEYKGFSLSLQLRAGWGGYSFLPGTSIKPQYGLEATNMPSFWNPDNVFVYQDIYDGDGDPNNPDNHLIQAANRDAYYPSLAYTDVNNKQSNFWRISGTNVTLSRITFAYTFPKSLIGKIGLQSARVNITGQNVMSFYNPYPDNFMSPLAGTYGNYPRLRKWTVGISLSF